MKSCAFCIVAWLVWCLCITIYKYIRRHQGKHRINLCWESKRSKLFDLKVLFRHSIAFAINRSQRHTTEAMTNTAITSKVAMSSSSDMGYATFARNTTFDKLLIAKIVKWFYCVYCCCSNSTRSQSFFIFLLWLK